MTANIRYTKQRTKTDCGAVVIANACKWSGMAFSFTAHRNFLLKELEIQRYGGVFPDIVVEFIEHSNVPFKIAKYKENSTLKQLEKELENDRAAIVFFHGSFNGHVFLITGMVGEFYKCVNYLGTKGDTVMLVSAKHLQKAKQLDIIFIKKAMRRGKA